jgi:hypothetical protein
MRVTDGIALGCPLPLTTTTATSIKTLKVGSDAMIRLVADAVLQPGCTVLVFGQKFPLEAALEYEMFQERVRDVPGACKRCSRSV